MIAVDIFSDLFDWDDKQRERVTRTASATRAIYRTVRAGRAAATPMVFVEAAIAVVDAVGAYARYRQSKEITSQLEVEADMLRRLLAELDEQLHIEARVAQRQYETQLNRLRDRLKAQELEIRLTEEVFDSLSRQVKKLGQVIAQLRSNAPPNCINLLQLEQAYYHLVDVQVQTVLDMVKE